jgi:hypothetical protein
VRDTELNIRTIRNEGFAILVVLEARRGFVQGGRDSTNQFHEHEVGTQAAETAVCMNVAKGLFASLGRDEREHARDFGVGAKVHMIKDLN